MGTRQELQTLLKSVTGLANVYFQPPENFKMEFPCIVYSRDGSKERFANNGMYLNKKRYKVIVIDSNPDSSIPDKLLSLSMCSFDRHYKANNLNHDVYNIYF